MTRKNSKCIYLSKRGWTTFEKLVSSSQLITPVVTSTVVFRVEIHCETNSFSEWERFGVKGVDILPSLS